MGRNVQVMKAKNLLMKYAYQSTKYCYVENINEVNCHIDYKNDHILKEQSDFWGQFCFLKLYPRALHFSLQFIEFGQNKCIFFF